MQRIGPSTGLPLDMVRPDVLLCLGEEEDEFSAALDGAGLTPEAVRTHYRAFHGRVRDDILCLDGAVGSAVVEKCLWDLLRTGIVRRVLLVGTAGAMPACTAVERKPYRMAPATSIYQNFDAAPHASWRPTAEVGLDDFSIVSCDRFYGFSPLIDDVYPAEPGLLEAWHQHAKKDLMIDMEVGAFYHYCERFGAPDLQYAAIKAVANKVSELDKLPEASADALDATVRAAIKVLQD